MSVVGIGTDILEIDRLAHMSADVLAKFSSRVLTPAELAIYQNLKFPLPYLAKRWAAKEAAAKALGTGIADGLSFQHIEVQSLESGQPVLHFSGRALELLTQLKANSWHLSLSDEKSYAVAFVVLSG